MDITAEFRTESWTDKDGERRIARLDYLARSGRKDGFLRSKLADKDGNPLQGFRNAKGELEVKVRHHGPTVCV